ASRSVISSPNSTIVVGTNMLIGGLLKVTVHRPGWGRAVLKCEWSGMAHLLLFCKTLPQHPQHQHETRGIALPAIHNDHHRRQMCYPEMSRLPSSILLQ